MQRYAPLLVFVLGTCWVGMTVVSSGLTWDECYYLGFAHRYRTWFHAAFGGKAPVFDEGTSPRQAMWLRAVYDRPFSQEVLRSIWGLDRLRPDEPTLGQKHPPLGKLISCAATALWGNRLGLIVSARLGSAALFGLLCAVLYSFAARHYDRATALFGVAALALMPRLYGHMRVATLEPALLLTTALTVFAFVMSIKSRGWIIGCGVLFGLALLTKINAAFIPFLIAPWGLFVFGRRSVLPIAAACAIGLLVFFLGWPALWHSPVQGFTWYLEDKLVRWPIPTFYFGVRYQDPTAPWHHPVVMLLTTTPVLVLAAAGLGAVRAVRRRRRSAGARLDLLFLWAVLLPLLILMGPKTSRCDGVRLLLSAFPFLALLAGRGAAWAWGGLRSRFADTSRAPTMILAAVSVWMLLPMALLHPYQLAYYNELIGGPWGARAAGMETTYWFDTLDRGGLAFLNSKSNVPENGYVALVPSADVVWRTYQFDGYARQDVRVSSFEESWDCLVVIPRQSFYTPELRRFMAAHRPAWQSFLTPFKRIPACRIYRRVNRDGRAVSPPP